MKECVDCKEKIEDFFLSCPKCGGTNLHQIVNPEDEIKTKKETRLFVIVFVCLGVFLSLAITVFAISMFASNTHSQMYLTNTSSSPNSDYISYIKKYNIDISDNVSSVEGEVNQSGAYLCFSLKENEQDKVREKLSIACGEEQAIDFDTMPGFLNHPIASKLKTEQPVAEWTRLETGKNGAITHPIYLYMTKKSNSYYLYFFD